MKGNLYIIKDQLYEINYLPSHNQRSLLTCTHSPTLGRKTANMNVQNLPCSLKLIVRTKWWYHSTKTAKIFWVTQDVAMHGAVYGRPMHSPI